MNDYNRLVVLGHFLDVPKRQRRESCYLGLDTEGPTADMNSF